MRHGRLLLAGPVLVLASCAGHDYWFTSHSGGRRGDYSKFTLNWVHSDRHTETTEYLNLAIPHGAIPYGPLGVSVDVDGKNVKARFGHWEGRDYVRTSCDEEHSVRGSVVILGQEPGGIRAVLRVTAHCPVLGNYDIQGEHTFEAQSVFYPW